MGCEGHVDREGRWPKVSKGSGGGSRLPVPRVLPPTGPSQVWPRHTLSSVFSNGNAGQIPIPAGIGTQTFL